MNLKLSLCDLLVIGEVKQGGKKSSSIPALGDSVQAGGKERGLAIAVERHPVLAPFQISKISKH